jgi:hypothetical protein
MIALIIGKPGLSRSGQSLNLEVAYVLWYICGEAMCAASSVLGKPMTKKSENIVTLSVEEARACQGMGDAGEFGKVRRND